MSALMSILKRKNSDPIKKEPGRLPLWGAFVFWNTVVVMMDLVAAATAYRVTDGQWLYAVLAFCAGAVPLGLHEACWYWPLGSQYQKKVAKMGAVLGVLGVFIVGLAAAFVNVDGSVGAWPVTPALIVVLGVVSVALVHGVLFAFYFYGDEGIRADGEAARAHADYSRQAADLARAHDILVRAQGLLATFDGLVATHGREEVEEVLAQISGRASTKLPAASTSGNAKPLAPGKAVAPVYPAAGLLEPEPPARSNGASVSNPIPPQR